MADQSAGRPWIAVGFDGSDPSVRALRWAAAEAERRGAELSVIRAWMPGQFGDDTELVARNEKALAEDTAAVIGPDAKVAYRTVAVEGHPGRVLLEQAAGAEMLVVGARGRGGFTGLLLGSVSQQMVAHAHVPAVVVIRQ